MFLSEEDKTSSLTPLTASLSCDYSSGSTGEPPESGERILFNFLLRSLDRLLEAHLIPSTLSIQAVSFLLTSGIRQKCKKNDKRGV